MPDPSFIPRLGMSAASGAASSFGSAAGSGIGNALFWRNIRQKAVEIRSKADGAAAAIRY
jgi:hypothetical protein